MVVLKWLGLYILSVLLSSFYINISLFERKDERIFYGYWPANKECQSSGARQNQQNDLCTHQRLRSIPFLFSEEIRNSNDREFTIILRNHPVVMLCNIIFFLIKQYAVIKKENDNVM